MADWNDWADMTINLLNSRRISKAQARIREGLEKYPEQINLLCIAKDVFRLSVDYWKSLECAEKLIDHHPGDWNGYGRAAQDLVALMRFDQAEQKIKKGLQKLPNEIILLKAFHYILAFLGKPETSISTNVGKEIGINLQDFIAYSQAPSFFYWLKNNAKTSHVHNELEKDVVFGAGLGRSGTAALWEMVNTSS